MPARAAVAAGPTPCRSLTPELHYCVDLDTLEITPNIGGKGGHGGYAGPAVKAICAQHAGVADGPNCRRIEAADFGHGGIPTWSDAAEFLLLGASSLQVCTAVMHYGFRIVEDLCDGLSN